MCGHYNIIFMAPAVSWKGTVVLGVNVQTFIIIIIIIINHLWRPWTQQCTEPLAWPHLDIILETRKMEEEKELH